MEYLVSILSGGLSSVTVVWLAKGWISERLKQSIKHEYAEKLESYKTELNSKVEGIRHENQVSQLRTSLFFDHQRDAFAALITKIAQINEDWMAHYHPDQGLYEPVPSIGRGEFEELFYRHQLFLDEECLLALSLVKNAYRRSLPFDDGSGAPPEQSETFQHVLYIEYLQPRIASVFRGKIGINSDPQHLVDIVVLSAIELVNRYHFAEAGVPPKGELSTLGIQDASDKVKIGLDNIDELKELLRIFDDYLKRNGGWFHEAQLEVSQTLKILDKCLANRSARTQQSCAGS
ncbi:MULTISPECIES: hypothetical protein [Gammaproteobacteria]|uniref:hypothetical protein n=1 Tax=Gammaproteobacteria TaxID=1236 RepID=UPI000DD04E7D|nr:MULTISPECIES: hypothetical protein [Gammaproteobacteria]RTE85501.1 hypothetical protein DQX04_11400 [Aliidiomarina sp. B3213]TCZ89470.1 hypothetical protein EYQ95_11325 [Lysobacter sp. N42]